MGRIGTRSSNRQDNEKSIGYRYEITDRRDMPKDRAESRVKILSSPFEGGQIDLPTKDI